MYNNSDRNREEVEREDRIEANTLRYLIRNENEKLLNGNSEEVQRLKKIHTLYNKLEQVLGNGETLSQIEKQNFEFIEKRIEEISRPLKEEIEILLEEFDNVSDKNRATEILFKLNEKYIDFDNKGFLDENHKKNFKFVKTSLEKINQKRLEEENKIKDDSWEEYKNEHEELEDEIGEI